MKRTVTEVRRKTRPSVLELQCPECTRRVRVAPDELFEGAVVQCDHCGCEAELTREFAERTGHGHWQLVDPQADYDDDAPRN